MAWINSIIYWNDGSTVRDISRTVISYNRSQNICSGIGTLDVVTEWISGTIVDIGDELVLYEEGSKKGTYIILTSEKSSNGNFNISCQDYSKRLVDYFVAEYYEIPDFSYTRTWIEFFLDKANVSYNFNTDSSGNLINNNTVFSRQSAYDIIQTLLQMSGWYLYFDANGICQIGAISKDLSDVDFELIDIDIIQINTNKNDTMLRNRAVVWGMTSPDDDVWVYADVTKPTPWDTSPDDKRAVVFSNSYVRNNTTAVNLAHKILNEFADITYIRTIKIHGARNIKIGDVIFVHSDYENGVGLVTSVNSELSDKEGLTSTIILDERCPRLFGYFGYLTYVYAGTDGAGVWRKPLDSDIWEPFSNGLELDDLLVTDLIIKNGIFACIAGNHCYINVGHTTSNWVKYDPVQLESASGVVYLSSVLKAIAVDIDSYTNNILIGYRIIDWFAQVRGEERSWIVEVTPAGNVVSSSQVLIDDTKQEFKLVDVEKFGPDKMPVAEGPASYCNDDVLWGERKVTLFENPEPHSNCFGVIPSGDIYENALVRSNNGLKIGSYYQDDHIMYEGTTVTWLDVEGEFAYSAWQEDEEFSYYSAQLKGYPFSYGLPFGNGSILTRGVIWREELVDSYKVTDIAKVTYAGGYDYVANSFEISPLLYRYPTQKTAVRVATTLPIVLSGLQTVDGVSLDPNMRVLVKDQVNQIENGIYVSSTDVWSRALDSDTSQELPLGAIVNITDGTVNINTVWQLYDEAEETIELGVSNLIFEEVLKITNDTQTVLFSQSDFYLGDFQAELGITEFFMREGVIYFGYYGEHKTAPDPLYPYNYTGTLSYYVGKYDMATRIYTKELAKTDNFTSTFPPFNQTVTTYNQALYPCGNGVAWIFLTLTKSDFTSHGDLVCVKFDKEGKEVLENRIWDIRQPVVTDPPKQPSVNNVVLTDSNIVCTGFKSNGNSVSCYIKFMFFVNTEFRYWGCLNPGATWTDSLDELVVGVVSFPDNVQLFYEKTQRGTLFDVDNCCCPYLVDDLNLLERYWDYDNVKPLQSKVQEPVFIYQNIYICDSINTLYGYGEIPLGVVSPILDEIDRGIYTIVPYTKQIYKTAIDGTQLAQIDASPYFIGNEWLYINKFMYCNELFLYTSTGYQRTNQSRQWHKLKDEFLFPGMRFCYLMNDDVPTPSGWSFLIEDFDFFSFKAEASLPYPLTSWTIPSSLVFYQYNNIVYTGGYEHLKIYDGSFFPTVISGEFNELRTVDLSGITIVESGSTGTSYGQYLMIAGRDNNARLLGVSSVTMDGAAILKSFSGSVSNVESSNRYIPPYFFVALSGPGSGFWQRNPGYSAFIDYTLVLPNSITIIRLDDRM